jgi:hypothetical protein
MRTEEFRLPVGFEALLKLEELRAHLAENLRTFFSVVEVEIDVWRATAGTDDMHRNL